MADRHYTAQPIDFDGESITVEGLSEALAALNAKYGGKPPNPKAVSPAMTLGGGATIISTESGRVMFLRDDAAKAQAEMREAADRLADGRMRVYRAEVHIGRVIRADLVEATADLKYDAEGLIGVMFQAAMFVQDTLGDVPDCMSYDAITRRERSMRAQLSRATNASKDLTTVHFPGVEKGAAFELDKRPGERYRVGVTIYVQEPEKETLNIRRA